MIIIPFPSKQNSNLTESQRELDLRIIYSKINSIKLRFKIDNTLYDSNLNQYEIDRTIMIILDLLLEYDEFDNLYKIIDKFLKIVHSYGPSLLEHHSVIIVRLALFFGCSSLPAEKEDLLLKMLIEKPNLIEFSGIDYTLYNYVFDDLNTLPLENFTDETIKRYIHYMNENILLMDYSALTFTANTPNYSYIIQYVRDKMESLNILMPNTFSGEDFVKIGRLFRFEYLDEKSHMKLFELLKRIHFSHINSVDKIKEYLAIIDEYSVIYRETKVLYFKAAN